MSTIEELRDEILEQRLRGPQRGGSPWPLLLIAGGLAGATLTYLYDPERGRTRRAQARDRIGAVVRRGARQAERAGRMASSQAYGLSQRVTHLRAEHGEPLNDQALAEKVKAELFRDADVPHGSININVERGVVVLRGQVDSPERISDIESRVRRVDGVWDVQNLLHLPGLPAPAGAG